MKYTYTTLILRAMLMILGSMALAPLMAQTTIISPTAEGGFETGTTFAANGWTTIGTNRNQYQIGAAAGPYAGARSAFIADSPTAWTGVNQEVYRHLYRDVTFPANETVINLTFYYKTSLVQATGVDGFTVRVLNTNVTPTTTGYPTGDLISGLTYGAAANTWYAISFALPAAYAGTTKRLVFSWYNNNGVPRTLGALDNIELTSREPFAAVTNFPYIEGFEEDVYGWVVRDADADGNNWFLFTNTETLQLAYSGVKSALSQSWITAGPLTPDNWLISPPFVIGEDYTLTWQIAAQDPTDFAEKYSVMISTTTTASDQFTPLFTETLAAPGWQYRTQSLAAYTGQTVYLAFRHYDTTDQYILKVDEIKILPPNTEITQGLIIAGAASLTLNPIQDLNQNIPVSVGMELSGLASGSVITTDVGYGNPNLPIPNPGLHIRVHGANFSGSTLTVNHNLGFVPLQVAWRAVPGAWNIISSSSTMALEWTDTTISILLPEGMAEGDVELVFPTSEDATLPVELSNLSIGLTPANLVQIMWVSQSETNLVGYRIYRGESNIIERAIRLDVFIAATNTSQQQVYVYIDKEVLASGTYYYWLEHLEMDGSTHLHGPISIRYIVNNPNAPETPVPTGIASIYPNPFNPATTIKFGLGQAAEYSLKIYNLKGQMVRNLAAGNLPKGFHKISWNGRDDMGNLCASGVYYLVLNSGKDSFTRKVILLK